MKKIWICFFLVFVLLSGFCPEETWAAAGDNTGKRDWRWPVPSTNSISSCYIDPLGHTNPHYAIDIKAAHYSEIKASYPGTVLYISDSCNVDEPKSNAVCTCGNKNCLGKAVYIKHTYLGKSFVSRYGHMASISVKSGDSVTKETTIGQVGSTGNSTGYHLDFKIYEGTSTSSTGSVCVDPFMDQFLELPNGLNANGASSSCTCCRDYVDEVIKLYATGYLNDCTYYPSYVEFTTPTASKVWSLPCSDTTSEESKHIDTTKAGDKLTSVAMYLNTSGNYWYKTVYNGKEGYIYGGNTEYRDSLFSDVAISGVVAPAQVTKGSSFVIEGVVSGTNNRFNQISVTIKQSGKVILEGKANGEYGYYSLKGSTIDKALTFGSLAVGSYDYSIDVDIVNNYTEDGKGKDSVGLCKNLYRTTFSVVEKQATVVKPGKPVLQIASTYVENSEVKFTWADATNSTHYNLYINKKNASGTYECIEQIFYAKSGVARNLAKGDYSINLLAYNSNSWESDGSDWAHTWGDTVYFTMNASSYTVTFNANGGSCTTTSKTVSAGGTIGTLPAPTRAGYKFIGWYASKNEGYNPVTSATTVNQNTTLYAFWSSSPYYTGNHVTFDVQGGQTGTYIQSVSVTEKNAARDNQETIIFDSDNTLVATNYWGAEIAVGADGGIVGKRGYNVETQLTVPAGGFVLSIHADDIYFCNAAEIGDYVGYKEENGKITAYLYDNQNDYLLNHKYVKSGNTYGGIDSEFPVTTKEGYLLKGWYTEAGGGEEVKRTDVYGASKLYAQWEAEEEATPSVTVTDPETGRRYERYEYLMSWKDAKAYCESVGGHLVTITSEAELELLKNGGIFENAKRGMYYIGLTDEEEEDKWKWVTGEAYEYDNFDPDYPEPSGGEVENYASMVGIENPPNKQVGEWNDVANNHMVGYYSSANTGFICEYENVMESQNVSGSVKSYSDDTAAITLELVNGDGEVVKTATVTGNSATYNFFDVTPAPYTLRVSKANHVTRSYEIVVGTADLTQDVTLLPVGDITGDGKVTATDYSRLLAHVKKTGAIADSYLLLSADVTGDGKITATDYSRLLAHVKKVSPLW